MLAELYDEVLMPKNLRNAHKENDNAVLAAYCFRTDFTESEIFTALIKFYRVRRQKLASQKRKNRISL